MKPIIMSNNHNILFSLLLFLFLLSRGNSLTIVQESANILIPPDFPTGTPIYRSVVINDVTGELSWNTRFNISNTAIFPSPNAPVFSTSSSHSLRDLSLSRTLFIIDRHAGTVMTSPHHPTSLSDFVDYTYALDITASDENSTSTMTLAVTISNETKDEQCTPKESICFSSSKYSFQVPESTKTGVPFAGFRPLAYSHVCPYIHYDYSINVDEGISVHNSNGELIIVRPLDYEAQKRFNFKVSCTISDNLTFSQTFKKNVIFVVKDVNDNPPYLQPNTDLNIEMEVSDIKKGKPLPIQLTVLDKDSQSVNNIAVYLNDPLKLFHLKNPVIFNNVNGKEMLLNTQVVAPKVPIILDGPYYNFSIIFKDDTLITSDNNEIIFHVKIYNESANYFEEKIPDVEFKVNISRYARKYAKIVQPIIDRRDGYEFQLSMDNEKQIFGVTNYTGIIYVNDEKSLRQSSETSYQLKLSWRKEGYFDNYSIIIVDVLENKEYFKLKCKNSKFLTCALYDKADSCQKSCGIGSVDAFCQWRSQPLTKNLSPFYATCSPDLSTCPNGFCDELENLNRSICPQDCTYDIHGEAFPSSSGQGIGVSGAPCTCNEQGTSCACVKKYAFKNPINPERGRRRGKNKTEDHNKEEVKKTPFPTSAIRHNESCGTVCIAVISIVSIVVISLILVGFILIKQAKSTSSDKHRHVANRMPLTAVVSDYVDDRTVAHTQTDTIATTSTASTSTETKILIDPKWEFRRDRLILQETLGEGEFGKVYKAQAWEIADYPGYTTVAVKTLKENGTLTEEQDLLSELNLLREVSHPNVIKLLGACTTKGGPLYIIVEYAALGCLKNYLRILRALRDSSSHSVSNPTYFSSAIPQKYSEATVKQELFSFSWQIAKGMAYLSDMKLLHRDLAARNILLDSGKVIKISDFGLSRDVYLGDAYLKTTKGRVPVKWMALESLEDQIYTIKSDVWSFGIVLWEIITLGASPYPGFTPESLITHLKRGYRMPQPDGCPKKFYKLMRMCWRENPHERPCFKELVEKLDRFLQDTVEYLPLDIEGLDINKHDLSTYLQPNMSDRETTPKGSFSAVEEDEEEEKDEDESLEEDMEKNTTKPNYKVNLNHKPSILQFSHVSGNGYESRLLLSNSPTDNSSGNASV